MAEDKAPAATTHDLLEGDLLANTPEIERRFREQVRREVAAHLAAGRPVFYGGLGEDAGKLFMLMPDGQRYEYRLRDDGTREIVRELGR
jgi:hypothetical protein